MIKEPTLLQYYPVLQQRHKALICRALNEQRQDGQGEIHLGILPFVTMKRVAAALKATTDQTVNHRIWADLCAKLEVRRWLGEEGTKKAWLTLNPYKVNKFLGPRPDLGVTLPVIPRGITRGAMTWNIGAREWQPEKILAAPRISLVRHAEAHDMYELAAPARYFDLAHAWLCDNCE